MKIVWDKNEQDLKNAFKSKCALIAKTMAEVNKELIDNFVKKDIDKQE